MLYEASRTAAKARGLEIVYNVLSSRNGGARGSGAAACWVETECVWHLVGVTTV